MQGHCHDRTHFWGRHMHCCHWGPWLLHRNCHHGPSWGGYLAMNSYHGHAWYRHLNCIAWICNSDILAGRKASLVRIILKEGKFQKEMPVLLWSVIHTLWIQPPHVGCSRVSQEKLLRFKPKTSILMTSICPDFRHRFWMATLLHFLYN